MPGQTITLNFDQGSTAHLILHDATGAVTTDLGTYSVAWSVDTATVVAINPVGSPPLALQFQAATPVVDGTANVSVTLHSSDPANHPDITDSFAVTITNLPPPGPVSSVLVTLDAPGPRLF